MIDRLYKDVRLDLATKLTWFGYEQLWDICCVLFQESVENLRSQKRDLIVDAEHLRSEITKLAKKLMKEPRFLESLFVEFSGFGQKTASKVSLDHSNVGYHKVLSRRQTLPLTS